MAESQEIGALRRRGRRRLVGAIALVLLAVIVLPMVFDSEPRQGAPAVSVRIPSEDDAGFSPKATPKAPVTPVAPKAVPAPSPAPQKTAPAPAPKAEGTPEEKPAPQAAAKPPGADAERQRAEAAISGEQFTVPVAALANAEKVKELVARLTEAKLPYYTEAVATAQGSVTRVRVGPFADRAAAEKAVQRLKTLGLKPGNITGKS
jgi:DedD protein